MACTQRGATGADVRLNRYERAPALLLHRALILLVCFVTWAILMSPALAEDEPQGEVLRACMTFVTDDFLKQKAANGLEQDRRHLAIENIISLRRLEEQYCSRYADCVRPWFHENDVAHLFSSCLQAEAMETYGLQRRK
jgi:hypothetical protein